MIDSSAAVRPSACIHPAARLGPGVEIGEYCVVGAGAVLGPGCRLAPHAIVRSNVELGEGVYVDSFAVIGGDAQMRTPDPAAGEGRVVIGARCRLREGVTVNRPAKPGGVTELGTDCFLMANSHVAHDVRLGNFVTLTNNAMIAGHVAVGSYSVIGGGAGVHQFVRIGESSMIGGNASIGYDVPPFAIAVDRNDICGLNLVGLRRRGFEADAIADLKRCFRAVFFGGGDPRVAAAAVLAGAELGLLPLGRQFLEFFAGGKRGFGRARRGKGPAVEPA